MWQQSTLVVTGAGASVPVPTGAGTLAAFALPAELAAVGDSPLEMPVIRRSEETACHSILERQTFDIGRHRRRRWRHQFVMHQKHRDR